MRRLYSKSPKLRCDTCGDLVEQWIGCVCIPCHNQVVFLEAVKECAAAIEHMGSDGYTDPLEQCAINDCLAIVKQVGRMHGGTSE